MNMHAAFAPSEETPIEVAAPSSASWLRSLRARFAAWARSCADYYAAAWAYEELSRLSDAQLRRRGLSRDILARDVSAGLDRGSHG